MKTSESIAGISAALVAAQADAVNAKFDSVNPHFKNRYASLSEVIDVMKPVLAKHGLAVFQSPELAVTGTVVLTTRIVHTSGEWMESNYPIQPTKNDPQGFGSAITYARRYTAPGILFIASEEDDDGNAASTPPVPQRPTQVNVQDDVQEIIDAVKQRVEAANSKDELKIIWDSLGIDKSDAALYAAMLEVFNIRIAQLKAKSASRSS